MLTSGFGRVAPDAAYIRSRGHLLDCLTFIEPAATIVGSLPEKRFDAGR